MRRFLGPAIFIALAAFLATPAGAQVYPNIPGNTVVGRLGSGNSGPPQAIPFSTLSPQIYGTQSANTVFAGPGTGSAALPAFRAMVTADLPTLPNPSASTLGGIESYAAVTHQWINAISTAGVPASTQPACADISNAGTTCTVNTGTSGATVPLLNAANTWSAAQTFNNSDIILGGSSTGTTTLTSANAGASNFTLTLPAVTDTLGVLGTAQTFSALQTFSSSIISPNVYGATAANGTLNLAGTNNGSPSGDKVTVTSGGTQSARFGFGLDIGTGSTDPGTGNLKIEGGYACNAPSTKTNNYSHLNTDCSLIFNGSGSITLTLLSASTNVGKVLWVRTIAAFTVVSNASNVIPCAGGSAGTAILAATAGKWAMLQSDGTNWQIMACN